MQNSSTQALGCIGKCTSGLSRKELDHITDNIQETLSHPKGKQIFARFLEKRPYTNEIKCLALYETCCSIIEEERKSSESRSEPSLEVLKGHVLKVKGMAEYLEGVPQIDMVLMESFVEAINSESSSALLAVLENTRDRCRNHLKKIHKNFKRYVSEPCPLTK